VAAYVFASYENKKTYAEIRDLYHAGDEEVNKKKAADQLSRQDNLFESVQNPVQPIAKKINLKFNDLVKQNKDIVGWIKINNTKIDYPVTQADNNEFYLAYDVNKIKNAAGSIFMDYRNQVGSLNRNIIVYGHDMNNGSMFADLLSYESKWNFDNKSIIAFDTLYADGKWKIFSAYTTNFQFDYIKTDFRSTEEYMAFLDTIKAKSIHKSDVELTGDDTILTLSTCSYAFDDARFVVHAKLIKSE
jgi:sortase B